MSVYRAKRIYISLTDQYYSELEKYCNLTGEKITSAAKNLLVDKLLELKFKVNQNNISTEINTINHLIENKMLNSNETQKELIIKIQKLILEGNKLHTEGYHKNALYLFEEAKGLVTLTTLDENDYLVKEINDLVNKAKNRLFERPNDKA